MNEVRHMRVTAGEGRFAIAIEAFSTGGQGISCFVYGGELFHVGGMALAAPGPTLYGRQLSRADVWSSTVPGHKDAEAAAPIARKLAIALGQPASVSLGVHVDDASAEDLALLGKNMDEAVRLLVEQLEAVGEGSARDAR